MIVGARAQKELSSFGDHLFVRRCDVLNESAVKEFRDAIVGAFGDVPALVCNAGQAREGNFFTI